VKENKREAKRQTKQTEKFLSKVCPKTSELSQKRRGIAHYTFRESTWALPRAFVHGGNAKITSLKILEKKRKMQAGKEFFQNR